MKEVHVVPGRLRVELIGDEWALVFGGLTRMGNRRARRTISRALAKGLDVVWFDGFEEYRDGSNQRVPIDLRASTNATLFVVGCRDAESLTLGARLRTGHSWRKHTVTRGLWKYIIRRLGLILTARSLWSVVKHDVGMLSNKSAPAMIVYGDEHSITSAWHAGKIWIAAPIGNEMPEGGP